ncbi:hypothetical protein AB6A40_011695, partial [Gnathostoma spinigerum]
MIFQLLYPVDTQIYVLFQLRQLPHLWYPVVITGQTGGRGLNAPSRVAVVVFAQGQDSVKLNNALGKLKSSQHVICMHALLARNAQMFNSSTVFAT